jgi:dihydrofolate reductase
VKETPVRKLIIGMHISIDGFVAGADGIPGYASSDDAVLQWIVDSLDDVDTIVLGRVAYGPMSAYWPTATDALASRMNSREKIVFTSNPAAASWPNTRMVSGDAAAEIARLKQRPGKNMIVQGGAALAQSVTRAGLVDEYRLITHPVALGAGHALFSRLTEPLHLRLVKATPFETGAVAHVYRPA